MPGPRNKTLWVNPHRATNSTNQETPVEQSAELFFSSSWGSHQPFANLLRTSNKTQTRALGKGAKGKKQNHSRSSTSMARAGLNATLAHNLPWGSHQPFANLLRTSNKTQTRSLGKGAKGKKQNHSRPSTSMARAGLNATLAHNLPGEIRRVF